MAVGNPLRWLGGQIDIRVEVDTPFLNEATFGIWDTSTWGGATWGARDPAWADISRFVHRVTIDRGKERWEQRFGAGTATVVVDNTSGIFTPDTDQPTPWYLPWRPGRRIRIVAVPDGSADPSDPDAKVPLFTGTIDAAIDQFSDAGFGVETHIQCVDFMVQWAGHDPIALETPTGVQSTDERVNAALDRLDWPEDLRDIQEGLHTMQSSFLAQSTAEECHQAAEAEGGAFFCSTDGKATFKARDWLTTDPRSTYIQGYIGYGEPDPIGPYLVGNHSGTVTVPHDSSLNITDAITIIAVARLNDDADISSYNRFCQKAGAWADYIGFRGNDGTALWYVNALSSWVIGQVPEMRAPSQGGDGKFHHLAYTYDKDAGTNNRRFYVDGNLRASRTDTGAFPTSNNAFDMITSTFGGDLAYVAIYDRQLSDQEIEDLHAGARITDGLVSEWKMIEGSGSTVYDWAGSNDGTISGLTWFDPGGIPPDAVYAPALSYRTSWELARIRNDIQLARVGGKVVQATDTNSITLYQRRTYRRLDYQNTQDSQLEFLAARHLAGWKDNRMRVDAVTIAANADPNNKDLNRLFWDTEFGDRLAIKVEPPHGWSYERESHVIGINHVITPDDWVVTFRLDDSQASSFSPPRGVLVSSLDPVAWWKFTETSGSTTADSANNHNITWFNSPTLTGTGGPNGTGLITLNGTNQYGIVANEAGLELAQDMSIEFWARPHSISAGQTIVTCRASGDPLYEVNWGWDLNLPGQARYRFYPFGSAGSGAAGPPMDPNEWHHIVFTVEWRSSDRVLRIYVDGDLWGGAGTSYKPSPTNPVINIGRRAIGNDLYFDGDLAELVIYDRVLTASQVLNLYNSTYS